jgi:hypothetical protein
MIRWAGHVAWGRREMLTKFWVESLRGRGHSEGLGEDRRIVLKWILGT